MAISGPVSRRRFERIEERMPGVDAQDVGSPTGTPDLDDALQLHQHPSPRVLIATITNALRLLPVAHKMRGDAQPPQEDLASLRPRSNSC